MISRIAQFVRRNPWTSVGLMLVVAMTLTIAARWAAIQQVENEADARQEAVIENTFATVETRFHALQQQLRTRARALATDSVIVRGLQEWTERRERRPSLVRHLLALPTGNRTTVEVYTSMPRVLAWNGHRMPFGQAPDADAFLQRPQTDVVNDGSVRQALVVWYPVKMDGEAIGAVRVVRTIRYQPPVRNRYIRGFDLQEMWERETGESIRLTWTPPPPNLSQPHRVLRSADDVLGYVTVVPPSPSRLVQRTSSFFNDVLAGWAVLLLGWGVCGLGAWYLHLARRPGVRRLPSAQTAAAGRLACLVAAWIAARYALLGLDVPGRWVMQGGMLSSLFDPTQFASTIGGGIFRSIGDLFLSGVWALLLAASLLHLALRYRLQDSSVWTLVNRLRAHSPSNPSGARFTATILGFVGITFSSILAVAHVVRRAVLDSTLDFFSRTGLLPEPLVFLVLCSLVLLLSAVVLSGTAYTWIGVRLGLRYQPNWPRGLVLLSIALIFAAGTGAIYLHPTTQAVAPFPYPLAIVAVVGVAALYGMVGRNGGAEVFTVRGLLLSLFVVTLLFYPLLYAGMDEQRRDRMVEAADSFEEGYDPRALYSIRQMLRTADGELGPIFATSGRFEDPSVDSVATGLVRRSLLASLTTYEVSLTLLDGEGTPHRRYGAGGRQVKRTHVNQVDREIFTLLQSTYARQLSPGPVIDRFAGERGVIRSDERFQYAGLIRVDPSDEEHSAWILVRAEPRSLLPGTGGGIPRVLLPDGSFSTLYSELSLAQYQDGTLIRSYGDSFNRTQLSSTDRSALRHRTTLWRSESIRGRQYLTYYHAPADASVTVAARIPSILAFDHLYYLLRLTVVALGVGFLVYLLALYGRYRYGLVPAERVRFRNKVLNAFLVVSVVSMGAVGVVGVQVVTGENERVVERRLRDHLARVEETLSLEARPNEALWQVAGRMDIDSLAARVGLDLRVYEDGHLVGTSRPRLVRDGLVDERLPGAVYHELHEAAYRFASAEALIGDFRYRVGFQALVDEGGQPRLVVGVPTLAQQEQVAEEQARTLAYLFGALLLLVVVVMLTAVVLANALAQPIARLREGLEAVGEGRFAQALPVDTRDEIGDLVRTFNEMRAQLAESRRKLAQQEREIAWREMARQVAHEIKNPLTPMKLSIQHLRRAFEKDHEADASAFADVFDRITTTLIEQIESLVRIANEFSTFARLPTRVLESLDLNEVIREAVRLMEEQTQTGCIELDLHPHPLVVEADREELRRTFINLLKNAVQSLPEDRDGRVQVSSALTEEENGKMVESRVIDNGTGIPPSVQDKIFDPNFSTKTSGTGLGLAIAQKSIDELGGSIGYETEEGEGTTFWVRLPLADDEPDAEGALDAA